MRTQTNNALVELSAEAMNDLLRIVDEKIAHHAQPREKTFKTIDLWKIQRSKKRVMVRDLMA